MLQKYKDKLLFLTMFLVLIVSLVRVDRIFFKRNSSFCIRFLYSSLNYNPKWDLDKPTEEQEKILRVILKQKFHYLAKGAHCYAFISEDQNYVIKFHRYPSHMRLFPHLTHPFSYQFDERRKKIKEHNFQKLDVNFTSYKNSFQNLQKETGLILAHINPTNHLKKSITLVDKTKAEYQVKLDDVTFLLQHKADLIYPTLDKLISEKKIDEAKLVVTHIIELITTCCQKGYVDEDPVLRKNYGLLKDSAIHIDVGDLVKNEQIKSKENTISHVKEMTESLRKRLVNQYPELVEHYHKEIEKLYPK